MRLGLASLPILLTGCILITGEGESSSSTGAGGQGGGAGGRDQTTGAGGMANGVELLEVATDPPSHGAILAISTSQVGLFAIGDGAPFVFRANPGAPPPLALKFLVGYPMVTAPKLLAALDSGDPLVQREDDQLAWLGADGTSSIGSLTPAPESYEVLSAATDQLHLAFKANGNVRFVALDRSGVALSAEPYNPPRPCEGVAAGAWERQGDRLLVDTPNILLLCEGAARVEIPQPSSTATDVALTQTRAFTLRAGELTSYELVMGAPPISMDQWQNVLAIAGNAHGSLETAQLTVLTTDGSNDTLSVSFCDETADTPEKCVSAPILGASAEAELKSFRSGPRDWVSLHVSDGGVDKLFVARRTAGQ